MLRRASMWSVIGSVTGVLAFAGLPPVPTLIAKILFYICAGFAALSLLFSLFEEADVLEPGSDSGSEPAPAAWRFISLHGKRRGHQP